MLLNLLQLTKDMYKKWITFFSQTGSEIVEISKYLNRWPDAIIVNRDFEGEPPFNTEILREDLPVYFIPDRPCTNTYKAVLNDLQADSNTLITLHGYLRILPKDICRDYTIYNGHPGDIELYPELKGFNPQEKAYANKDRMSTAGSVIHLVTEEVDGGAVVARKVCDFDVNSLDEAYSLLHTNSVQLWVEFLENLL